MVSATRAPVVNDPLAVTAEDLRRETRFPVRIFPTLAALHEEFAERFADLVEERTRAGKRSRVSLPVGPFD